MRAKRTIELTVERSTFSVHRRVALPALFAWCDGCRSQVQMISPEAAAARSGVSLRAIYRRVEAGEIHFVETRESSLLVCLASLG